MILNTIRARLILNAWSDKARRLAAAKRGANGLKKGFVNPRLQKRASEVSAARIVRMKAEATAEKKANAPLPESKRAKRKAELSGQVKDLLDFYRGLRKKLEAKLKVKVPAEIPKPVKAAKTVKSVKKSKSKKKKVGK